MGLASALSTALTGLNAAETTIDVVGNNVANSNTIGFKSSKAVFATQFLQTSSLGSAPVELHGGTNPRQVGLGTKVSEITPDFTQGTIQVSSNPSDLALQGDGFFIVKGSQGEQLYTRNGSFKTNSSNELITTTGQRLLGYGVDENFQIQQTTLVPLTIPLGSAAVAQATQNATITGALLPTGDVSTQPGVVTSATFGDGSKPVPPNLATSDVTSLLPVTIAFTPTDSGVAGAVPAGTYTYKLTQVTADGAEGPPTLASASVTTTGNQITLNPLPAVPSGFASYNVYRADSSGVYSRIASGVPGGGSFTDNVATGSGALPDTLDQGNYSYYVTFFNSGDGTESRPTALIGPQSIVVDGRRVELKNLPTPTPPFDSVRVYRNSATNTDVYHLVSTPSVTGTASGYLASGISTFTDGLSEAAWATQPEINFDKPPITPGTLLTDVVRRNGNTYEHPFSIGTLQYTPTKGGKLLLASGEFKSLEITATTTVQDFVDFVQKANGIRTDIPTPSTTDDPSNVLPAGGTVNASTGQIIFTSNLGTANEVQITNKFFKMIPTGGAEQSIDLGFTKAKDAIGAGVSTDFVVVDSLGTAVNVRLTAVLESRDNDSVTYRWFADSEDNQVAVGGVISPQTSVGTGLIRFDGSGNISNVTNNTVSIGRDGTSSSTLQFNLDFSRISGLDGPASTLSVPEEDGFPAGTLTSYIIGEDGLIRGVFSNGISRDLGQLRIARFANNAGLEQKGENLFATSVNSGLPVIGVPGQQGIGSIVAGAQELSNTDIGQNLIDLITASTAYRGGARVITTVQQLFDELLNLRR